MGVFPDLTEWLGGKRGVVGEAGGENEKVAKRALVLERKMKDVGCGGHQRKKKVSRANTSCGWVWGKYPPPGWGGGGGGPFLD